MSLSRYRAWDKENSRMVYPSTDDVYFVLTDDGINILDMSVEPFDDVFPRLDAVLMQSTGLQDKNGAEIFEGDVLKRKVHVVLLGIDLDEWVEETYLVEWKYGGWHIGEDLLDFVLESGFDRHSGCYQTALEVLGNIYENPERLSSEIE